MSETVHDVLGVAEAAAYLHIKPAYLYQLTSKRNIAYSKPTGGRVLFLREDLDAFVRRGRRAPDHELAEKALLSRPTSRRGGAA